MRSTMIIAVLAIMASLPAGAQQTTSAALTFSIGNAKPGDTLRLQVWNKNLSERNQRQIAYRLFLAAEDKGVFRFSIDSLEGPVYFSLFKDKMLTTTGYTEVYTGLLMEPGDDVKLSMDSLNPVMVNFFEKGNERVAYRVVHPVFTGRGSGKYSLQLATDQQVKDWLKAKQISAGKMPVFDSAYYEAGPARMHESLAEMDALLRSQLSLLDSYKDRLSVVARQIIKANLIGKSGILCIGVYNGARSLSIPAGPEFKQRLKEGALRAYEARKQVSVADIPASSLVLAANYIDFITDDAFYTKKDQYFSIKKNYSGLLRDKLVADLLLKDMFYLKNSADVINDAVTIVQDDFCLNIVSKIYNTQRVGSTAFNFSLQDVQGKTIQLSDFKGRIVFIDLWYTGCGACAGFYKYQLSRVEEHFKDDPNVVFITISIDTNFKQWISSVQEGTYSSPHAPNVFNLYTNGQGSEHPMIKAYNVMGYPHPFMVDRQGRIYKIDSLQALAEDLIPIINGAIAKKS